MNGFILSPPLPHSSESLSGPDSHRRSTKPLIPICMSLGPALATRTIVVGDRRVLVLLDPSICYGDRSLTARLNRTRFPVNSALRCPRTYWPLELDDGFCIVPPAKVVPSRHGAHQWPHVALYSRADHERLSSRFLFIIHLVAARHTSYWLTNSSRFQPLRRRRLHTFHSSAYTTPAY